jgi:UDP-galactopyranose mutase
MLTPGERVLTVSENRNYNRPIEITVISKLDGKQIARNQIKYIPNEMALSGI